MDSEESDYEALEKLASNHIHIFFIVIIISLIVAAAVISLLDLYYIEPGSVFLIELFSIIGSLTLSAVLATLYLLMWRAQSKQANILEKQSNLMLARIKPQIDIEFLGFGDDDIDPKLKFRISNEGDNRRAENFRIITNVDTGVGPNDVLDEKYIGHEAVRSLYEEGNAPAITPFRCGPNQSKNAVGYASFHISNEEESGPASFNELAEKLLDVGQDSVTMEVEVGYDDAAGNEYSYELFKREVPLHQDLNIRDAYNFGNSVTELTLEVTRDPRSSK